MKKLLLICAIVFGFSTGYAQVQAPQPSPFAKVEQKVGLTDVTLEYSRPGVRGREIFGNLVSFGEVWRTGANQNTKITFSDDISINGKELKKGTYAIYTIPGEKEWEVIFYKDARNWGNPEQWDEEKVALKAKAEVKELPNKVETFTISIDNLEIESADLNIMWDNTLAYLTFDVPTEMKAMASIEKTMSGPGPGDYFAAASFYHDANKDLETAYEWINKSIELGNDAYWVLRRKSLIEADLGKKEEAIATAKESLAAAEKAGNKDYIKMNQDSLKEWGVE